MESAEKKTLVLGASANPGRYSYLAMERLLAHHHPVVAIGKKETNVLDISIGTQKKPHEGIDTVTIYLNPENQKEYYDYIVSLHPRRVIFNPGAENPELEKWVTAHGIQALEACSLVLLSTGQY